MKKQGLTVEEAKKKAEYFCAYQDRCYKEVEVKLISLGMYAEAREHILQHLVSHGFLDEERFAKSFARGKNFYKGWAKKRIELELKMRDISRFNIQVALKEIEEDYTNRFFALAEKKWESLIENNQEKKKKKWTDYLLRKGYEYHLINEAYLGITQQK